MTKFFIEYNPYLLKCTFMKDGILLGDKSKLGAKSNERLQILLGESTNWKGLAEEIANSCDDDEIEITFKGRKIDYDDLVYTIELYTGDVKFSLVFDETKNDSDILGELDSIFEDIKDKNLPEFAKKNEEGKDIFAAYEEVKNGIFEVSVIATMSSGKSTLINSILHTELLPSENKACTATICRILDNDDMDTYEAECYGDDNETVIYSRKTVTSEDMKLYNADESVKYIDIEGSVPAIPSDKIRLCLRDTPGPNNSRDENHEKLTNSIIKRTNAVVLYVMNATQIGIKDDKNLLKAISSEMKRAGKQSRDRFIFVVNKCDALDEEKGETIDKLINDVRDYLKGFDIVDPTIIPTSARLALLIRKSRKGDKLSRQENNMLGQVDDFVESELLHFEKYATLTPTVKEKLQKLVESYHDNEDDWDMEALIHTGVPAVEETICEYIEKYAYPMKIQDALKDIVSILDELDMKTKFDESIASDESELEMVREQIADARKQHSSSKEIYESFKKKIDSFSLDSISEDDELYQADKEAGNLTKEYDKMTKVDKSEADSMIDRFQETLDAYQKNCQSRLNAEFDKNVYKKGEEMLAEYTKLVQSILSKIQIKNYEFYRTTSFASLKITDINQIKKRNQKDRMVEVTRWKDNPERAGFFGFFKFWEPRELAYKEKVKDGVDVNVKNVIVDIMSVFSKSLKDNIRSMFSQANQQVDIYKSVFNENIDQLELEIEKMLEQLDLDTRESEVLRKRVEENRETAEWVQSKEEQIRKILRF